MHCSSRAKMKCSYSHGPILFVALEASKALTFEFLLQLCPNRKLPYPNALLTLFPEIIKSSVALFYLRRLPSLGYVHYFIAHSILYFLNNALYILLLKYTSSSTIQFWTLIKLPITAILHSLFINTQRKVRPWIYLFMIFIGVVLTQLNSNLEIESFFVLFVCILLAINSSTAAIYNELLLKSLDASFWEQQCWVYFLGTLWNSCYLLMELEVNQPRALYSSYIIATSVFVVFISAYAGIVVGFLVKKFDNVIKLQSSAVSTVFIGILSSCLFSKSLNNSFLFFLGSTLIISFTCMYAQLQRNNIKYSNINENQSSNIRIMLGMILLLLVVGFFTMAILVKSKIYSIIE